MKTAAILSTVLPLALGERIVSQTPPMGWMSWMTFRCQVACDAQPNGCVNDQLYMGAAGAMINEGYKQAGYNLVAIDDCWNEHEGRRADGRLHGDPKRFPKGVADVGKQLHAWGMDFGIYLDVGYKTCDNYPGSKGYEHNDAQMLKEWDVDYVKVDGCNNLPANAYDNITVEHKLASLKTDYTLMGGELDALNRNITYSCSWPAYVGFYQPTNNETNKPFTDIIDAGCNLWRNYDDIQCSWASLENVVDHFGNYSRHLSTVAGPGHWNDMDMLLIGTDCITHDEGTLQMAIWSIMASPLIMGNDVRIVQGEAKSLLQNSEIIAVNQDPLGKAGFRITDFGMQEIWARDLQNGDIAVAMINKADVPTNMVFDPKAHGDIRCNYRFGAKDLVAHRMLGDDLSVYNTTVAAHGASMIRITCVPLPVPSI